MYRLLSVLLALLPLSASRRERLKAAIYTRFGGLFRASHNYADWLRIHAAELEEATQALPLAAPSEPDEPDDIVQRVDNGRFTALSWAKARSRLAFVAAVEDDEGETGPAALWTWDGQARQAVDSIWEWNFIPQPPIVRPEANLIHQRLKTL